MVKMKKIASSKPKLLQTFLANISVIIVGLLSKLQRKLMPPQTVLLNFAIGNTVITRSIYVVVELGIADLLKDGPKNIKQLSKKTGADEDTLYRIMRTLTSEGIFKAKKNKYFETNLLGKHLQTDLEDSMYSFIKATGADWANDIWGDILKTAKTGKDFYENKYGMNFFDWLRRDAKARRLFTDGMTSISAISDIPVANAYDFSNFDTIVDIGGYNGSQLKTILEAYPGLKGFLFDLPLTIKNTKNKNSASERLHYAAGDFFDSVPPGHDLYIMKSVLHDFDDKNAIAILLNISKAMRNDSTLLIVENVIKEDNNESDFSKILDINVMAMMGGRVRTLGEYNMILEDSGLRLNRIIPTSSPYSILEVKQVLTPGLNLRTCRGSTARRTEYCPS
jgi:DNA-binding Lrp family transcriptional regulator